MMQSKRIPRGEEPALPRVQAEVAHWMNQLTAVAERLGPRFARAESRQRALSYVRGLLSPLERKHGWQLAEQAGERQPDTFPHRLNRATWSAEAVRDDLRRYVSESLGDPQAVLVVDETGFRKKGTKSAGVARQYSGTAGKIDTCQIGVFLAYASAKGRPWLDREWSLPQEWLTDQDRCQAAGIPAAVMFQTTPQVAQVMRERVLTAGVPAQWVTGDEVYGHDRKLRLWLESWPQAYVMAVPANEPVWQGFQPLRVEALIAPLAAAAWQRLSAGEGAKGPRLDDWALVPLNPPLPPGWCRWLLARRSLEAPTDLAYYVVYAPEPTPLAEMVRAAGSRWSIEECIEATKGDVGLDQYEVRLWSAWYRHITRALFAHAFLTVVRAQAELEAHEKRGPRRRPARLPRRRWPRPLRRSDH